MVRGDGTMLVLGASGFLGVHVARAALAGATSARDVVLAVRDASRLPASAGLGAARVHVLELADPGSLEQALDVLEPELILNCAALARVDACDRDPALARALDADVPARLARWCAAFGCDDRSAGRSGANGLGTRAPRLVHVSTDLVFGGAPPRASGYREDDAVDPRSEYGRAKAAGEAAVLAADASALVVRLPLLFGDSFGRGLGASDSLLAAIARGERPVLFTDEWRTPLDVAHAAAALVELALSDAQGVLHVAGAQRMSRLELGRRVVRERLGDAALAGLDARTRAEAGAAGRPADVSLDASRWRALLAAAKAP